MFKNNIFVQVQTLEKLFFNFLIWGNLDLLQKRFITHQLLVSKSFLPRPFQNVTYLQNPGKLYYPLFSRKFELPICQIFRC